MADDLRQFDAWVRADRWPHAACPVCKLGYLVPGEITSVDTASSLRAYRETSLASELKGTFHGSLKCARHACKETVTVAGDYFVDYQFTDNGRREPFDFYRLRFALPALKIILPPPKTPESVTAAIESAALVIWTDPSAAANRLRFAIDELMTAYRVPRYRIVDHKRRPITTDARIREFGRYESGADALLAVKWIGNQGSHESDLSVTDVLDGAELLSHALKILYDRSDDEIERRIRAVNKRKGLPRGKRTRQ